ncbi:MAG: GGDEF domain-containing protein [Lachnospiraceae bacterium]|nr:GGDEF domain-containing protein [Lachnospiraceae bacterium]
MKRKLAIYANGYNIEQLRQALDGIQSHPRAKDSDIFIFMSFASYGENPAHNQGELNIYNLGHIEDYDGIIIFSNHLNSPDTAIKLCRRAKEKGVPVVSVGMPVDDIPCVRFSNDDGMRALVTHLVEYHHVKRLIFLGGPADHGDSNERLEVTKSVLAAHGLELKEEDIVYGDWGNTAPRMLIDRLVETKTLPDALVCANDVMALGAVTEFTRLGYNVPDDLIITGFDRFSFGTHYYPALTTVNPNFEEIGRQCCELIYSLLDGRSVPESPVVPSLFSRAESCGCTDQPEYVRIRNQYCKFTYQHYLETNAIDMFESILRHRISETTDYASLKKEIRDHYSKTNIFEGREFYLVINPEYFEDVVAKEEEILVNGYKDQMEAVVSYHDGKMYPEGHTNRHEIIPSYQKRDDEQRIFYIAPLHYLQYNYGYMVFSGDATIIRQNMCGPYLEKLQQSLKFLRINLRLDGLNKDLTRIYNRDPMTGLYNRLAYEEKAAALYEQSLIDKTHMMVMFVDINYMKRINDRYGHLHGDNAIKTVADSIRSVLKDDWIAVRFGGDEFLLIATNCNEEAAVQVRHSILSYLEIKNHNGTQPYEISASCGYVITDPETPSNLQEYVKEADNLMYKIKQEVHANDGKSRY